MTSARNSILLALGMGLLAGLLAALGLVLLSGSATMATEAATSPDLVHAESPTKIDLAAVPERVRLPDRIPKRIEGLKRVASGTLKTPLGPARWVHLYGADRLLPESLSDLIRVPGGYATTEPPGHIWFSPDLLHWKQLTPPVSSRWSQLSASGPDYWLQTTGDPAKDGYEGERLWRSTDARTWTEVDLSELGLPQPSTLGWQVWTEAGVASNGRIAIVPLTYRVWDMSETLGLHFDASGSYQPGATHLEAGDGGTYIVRGGYGEELATVRFEETSDGLRVLRGDDRQELAVARDLDLAFIERWADSMAPVTERRLAIIDGSDVRFGTIPKVPTGSTLGVWAKDDSFIAAAPGPDGFLQTWSSRDGDAWVAGETIGDDDGEPAGFWYVPWRSGDGTWRATTRDANDRFMNWASPNLTDWQRVVGGKVKLGDHLVKLTGRQLSIDGVDRQPELKLDITPFRKRQTIPSVSDGDVNCGGGSSGTTELGAGLLANFRTKDCRSTDIWIIEFKRFAN
jgi:hypothetical protein